MWVTFEDCNFARSAIACLSAPLKYWGSSISFSSSLRASKILSWSSVPLEKEDEEEKKEKQIR